MKYLDECVQDDVKLQQLVEAYFKKTGQAKGQRSNRGSPKFSLHEYRDIVKVRSGIENRCPGEMMWEKAYLEHAQSTRGGRLREDVAHSQWDTWVRMKAANPKSVIWDMQGPNPERPLQFRIELPKRVDFVNSYDYEKEICSTQKFAKGVTPEQLEQARIHALSNGEHLTTTGRDIDFRELVWPGFLAQAALLSSAMRSKSAVLSR